MPWPKGKPRPEETKRKISENRDDVSGNKNPNWKGGKITHTAGYILLLKSKHPFCNYSGYVLRSRLVMEKKLGRYLNPEERMHHKGIKYPLGSIENKQDDRPENLQLFPNISEHHKFHHELNRLSLTP